jgi:hypothetical protein
MRAVVLPIAFAACDAAPGDEGDTVAPPVTDSSHPQELLAPTWSMPARDVAGVGDVNGDGFDDLVSATWWTTATLALHVGSASGLDLDPVWTDERERSDELGRPTRAGDVDGDGYGDVLFGDYDHAPGGPGVGSGRAAAYYGSSSGLGATADWSAFGESGVGAFAADFAAAGDVDGDGFDDVIVSDPVLGEGQSHRGRVYLYRGSAEGLGDTAAWTAEGEIQAWFGASIAGAGDVNGDGFDDVVVGAPFQTDTEAGGRAYLFLGSASGLGALPAWTGHGDESVSPHNLYGGHLAGIGDVNGDGFDDLLVGAPGTAASDGPVGRVHLYLGSAAGPSETAWDAGRAGDGYGWAFVGAGDLDGDGYADVAFNDYGGTVEVFLGSPAGLPTESAWMRGPHASYQALGSTVGPAGDVDGDGFDDLVVVEAGFDNADGRIGRAWGYAGAPTAD